MEKVAGGRNFSVVGNSQVSVEKDQIKLKILSDRLRLKDKTISFLSCYSMVNYTLAIVVLFLVAIRVAEFIVGIDDSEDHSTFLTELGSLNIIVPIFILWFFFWFVNLHFYTTLKEKDTGWGDRQDAVEEFYRKFNFREEKVVHSKHSTKISYQGSVFANINHKKQTVSIVEGLNNRDKKILCDACLRIHSRKKG
jgi:hypothetical protein